MDTNNIEEIIKSVINDLRPYLNSDGGDIEFIKYDDGTVFVKLFGACGYCMHSNETLKNGVLKSIQEKVPEVNDIICVNI